MKTRENQMTTLPQVTVPALGETTGQRPAATQAAAIDGPLSAILEEVLGGVNAEKLVRDGRQHGGE